MGAVGLARRLAVLLLCRSWCRSDGEETKEKEEANSCTSTSTSRGTTASLGAIDACDANDGGRSLIQHGSADNNSIRCSPSRGSRSSNNQHGHADNDGLY